MQDNNDPLGILGDKKTPTNGGDPLGILKKKGATVSPSVPKQQPISSVTPPKGPQKPSVSSVSGKDEGLYKFPGNEQATYKKQAGQWYVDPSGSGKFTKLYKGDVEERVKLLESKAVPYSGKKQEKNVFSGVPGKENVQYILDTSGSVPVWRERKELTNVPSVETISATKPFLDKKYYDEQITDPTRVQYLNKYFKKDASTSQDEKTFTGLPNKEKNEYKIEDGTWKRRQPNQDNWTSIYDKDAIAYLNKHFKQDVKVSPGASKYAKFTENVDEIELNNFDNRLNTIDKSFVANNTDDVIQTLRNKFPEFKFQSTGLMTDEILVIAPNDQREVFNFDSFSEQANTKVSDDMKGWMRRNSNLRGVENVQETIDELSEKEKQLKKAKLPTYDPQIKLGEGYGIGPEMNVQITEKAPEEKVDLFTAEQEVREARKQYATSVARAFKEVKDRQVAATRKGSRLTEGQVAAEYAQLPKDYSAIRRANEYANDVKDSLKAYSDEVKSVNKYVEDIYSKVNSGEISKERFELDYKPLIDRTREDLAQRGENLNTQMKSLNYVDASINESVAQEYIINEAQGSFGGALAYKFVKGLTYIPRLLSEGEIDKQAQDELARLIVGNGTKEEYMESENRSDIEKALFSLSESMGALASGALLGGGPATYAAFFAQSYYEMKDDLDKVKGMSDTEKVLMSSVYGAVSSVLEKFGVDFAMQKTGIGKNLTNSIVASVFKDIPKNAPKEFVEAAIKNNTISALSQAGLKVVGAGIVEGVTETTQALAQLGIKKADLSMAYSDAKEKGFFDDKTGWELLGDAAYEGWLGALGGGVMGTVSNSYKVITDGARKAMNREQLEVLFNSAKMDGIPEALLTNLKSSIISGKISKDEAQNIYNSYNEVKSKIQSIPEEYSVENKSVALDLMLEKDRINKQIAGKDANLVKPQTDRIAEINNQLKTIGENAVKESTKPVEEVTAEGGGVQYQGTQEGQPEVGQGEGAVGQAAQPEADFGDRAVEGRSEAEIEASVQQLENYFNENTRPTEDSKYNPDLSGEGELALREQENSLIELGADRIQAHGLTKGSIGQQFKDLLKILTKGLDTRGGGQLYTAPLVVPESTRAGAGAALGTSGGTAYMDGGFIILARDGVNEIRSIDDIGGVLVNQAVVDTLPELVNRLKESFPNLSIDSYSNATNVVSEIISTEKNKTVEGRGVQEERVTRQIVNRPAVLSEFGGKTFDTPLKGDVYVEGQQVIFEDRSTGRMYELGNVDEVMDTQVPGLSVEQERVAITPEGKVSIEGSNWNIQSELPTQGIEYNPAGEVMTVSLKDDAGNTKMFKGQDAVDIAYQIELQKYQTEEQQQFINDLLEQDEEFKAATESIKPAEVAAVVQEEAAPDIVPAQPAAVEETVTVEQTVAEEAAVDEEVERLGRLLEGTDEQIDEEVGKLRISKDNNKVAQSISNAAKAIAKILPDVKFVVHDTDESYRKATGEQNRKQSTAGEYNPKTRTIHINGTKANNRTAAHEVFHAVILEGVKNNAEAQRLAKAMINAVMKSLVNVDGAGKVISYLKDFSSNYEQNIQNEEKLAELFGILADNYATLPVPTQSLIRRFLDRLAKIFGLKPLTDREVIDFMNVVSQKVARGEEIQAKEIIGISRGKIKELNSRFQADFSDAISKLTFIFDKNGDRFKKLEKDGFITRDKSLSDFNGKYIFLHQPDAAFSGMIFKDGEVLVEGKGGVFYPIKFHEDGYFWASTDRTAKKMADDLNKVMEQNGGTIYMALTSAPSDKLMSSTTMANAILDFFSSKALDKNFKVTPAQLKSALRKAANDVKSVNNKKVGLNLKLPSTATIEDIQSAIKTALGSENSSFADRKNFAVELTKLMAGEINKNDVAVNQFGKLFSEGIQNKYFKGITKTGKLKISAANMTQALSEMFTEPMLKEGIDREKGGQVYAILELNGPVKAVKSDKHESYPMAIESANKDNKVTLHLLNDRQNWFDTFEDFETGDIVSKERQLKVYPTSGVSVQGLKVNTGKVAPETKTARKQMLAPNGKPSNLNEKQWNQVRTPEFKKWFGDWENDPENASKVVDENGEPLVVYHGSLGEFDEFESRFLGSRTRAKSAEMGFFFSDDKKVADSYVYYGQLQNPNIDDLKPIIYGMTKEQLGDFQSTVLNQFDDSDSYIDEDLEYFKDDIFRAVEYDSEQNILDSFKYIEKAEKFLKSKNINKEFSAYPKGYIYESFLNIRNPKQQNLNGDVFDSTYTLGISNNNDGVILDNAIDSVSLEEKDGGIESKIVIALEPTQIKSATENVGTFSTEEKSIRKQIDNSFEARKQKPRSITDIINAARQNGFSDAAIQQYLSQQGYSQQQITNAMASVNPSGVTIDDVFKKSQEELESKLKSRSIKQRIVDALRSTRRTLLNRQTDIKRALRGIKNKEAKQAYAKLVTKAGASGFAGVRFKIVSKKIYGKLKESEIKALDSIIYARRIISINENRRKINSDIYDGLTPDMANELDIIITAVRNKSKNDLADAKKRLGDKTYEDLINRAKKYRKPYTGISIEVEVTDANGNIVKEKRSYNESDAQRDLVNKRAELGDERFNEINRRADIYFGVFEENLKKLKDSGRINEETYNNLKDVEYSPIKTIKYILKDNYDPNDLDKEASRLGISKQDIMSLGDENENGIITDSRWLLMMNLNMLESRVFENQMLNELVSAIENATAQEKVALSDYFILDNPIIGQFKDGRPKRKFDDEALPDGYTRVHYFKDGIDNYIIAKEAIAKQILDVKNSKITPAIEQFNEDVPVLGWLVKQLVLTPGRLLRFFATGGNPFFILGNVPMDWANAVFFNKVYSHKWYEQLKVIAGVKAAWGFVKNFTKSAISKGEWNKIYMEYAEHGGLMEIMSQEGLRALQEMKPTGRLAKKLPGVLSPIFKSVAGAPYKLLEGYGKAMSYLGETSEIAMRLAVYEKMKSNLIDDFKKENGVNPTGKQLDDIMWEASREARELIDFNQGGSWSKEVDVFLPYFNASMQGLRKPLDYARENKWGFASSMVQLALMGGSVAIYSIASGLASFDDEDEEERKKKLRKALDSITAREKANYHIIFTGKKDKDGELQYIRIKKLPIASIITTAAENLVYQKYIEYDNKKTQSIVNKSAIPVLPSEIFSKNPLISGILTYAYNEDTYTGEKVFREPKNKKILPTAEGMFDDKVEGVYKTLAPSLGLSPARSKAFVEKFITNESVNPTINIIYAALNGVFDKGTTFGDEFGVMTEELLKHSSKKFIRNTNKDIIKYNLEDEFEKKEMKRETEIYLKEQKMYNDIKKIYDDKKSLTVGELENMVKNNFDVARQKSELKKYYSFIQNMNMDRSLLDIVYEDNPEVQSMRIYERYGNSIDKQEVEELSKIIGNTGKRINKRTWYYYEKDFNGKIK